MKNLFKRLGNAVESVLTEVPPPPPTAKEIQVALLTTGEALVSEARSILDEANEPASMYNRHVALGFVQTKEAREGQRDATRKEQLRRIKEAAQAHVRRISTLFLKSSGFLITMVGAVWGFRHAQARKRP